MFITEKIQNRINEIRAVWFFTNPFIEENNIKNAKEWFLAILYAAAVLRPYRKGMSMDEISQLMDEYTEEIAESAGERISARIQDKYRKKRDNGEIVLWDFHNLCTKELREVFDAKTSIKMWWEFHFGSMRNYPHNKSGG